jgi:UDP-GlcNAc:undecaprenyl-phosphate/decaprenyl-phosphate GlcNAc-1-phosphate transferase
MSGWDSMQPHPYCQVISFLCATAAAALAAALALRSPLRGFFADRPDSRKFQRTTPIPRLGGICIIATVTAVLTFRNAFFTGACALQHLSSPVYYAVLLTALVIFCLGFFDDSSFARVRVRHKAIVELALAAAIVLLFDLPHARFTVLSVVIPAYITVPAALLWLVGLMNAFNFIDGVDGLAGGIAVIAFVTLSVFATRAGDTAIQGLCLVLAGATLGFFFFNLQPARMFLGDTGSLFLGSMVGTLTLSDAATSSGPGCQPALFLVAAVPVMDLILAVVRRFSGARNRGLSVVRSLCTVTIADSGHIHHRLVARGLSHMQTTLVLCAMSALWSISGLAVQELPLPAAVGVLAFLGTGTAVFLLRL